MCPFVYLWPPKEECIMYGDKNGPLVHFNKGNLEWMISEHIVPLWEWTDIALWNNPAKYCEIRGKFSKTLSLGQGGMWQEASLSRALDVCHMLAIPNINMAGDWVPCVPMLSSVLASKLYGDKGTRLFTRLSFRHYVLEYPFMNFV